MIQKNTTTRKKTKKFFHDPKKKIIIKFNWFGYLVQMLGNINHQKKTNHKTQSKYNISMAT